jgi:endonuclease YncB( thermonuclease family)
MTRIAAGAIALIISLLLGEACAAELAGRVVGIADGDTISVLDSGKTQHRVRLAGIDAPEKGQPFGTRSRENLSKWVHRRDVIVEWHKKDRYGRLVGVVLVDGHDVNLEQVRAGFAWWYRDYAKEQTPKDREVYEMAEKAAKEQYLGLWADPKPVAPWEWRRHQR